MPERFKNNSLILTILVLAISSVFCFVVMAQRIPEIARQQASEKDVLEVYCLMTKWKTGEFFAALDALQEVLIPAMKELESIGISSALPDISEYSRQAQEKLETVCNSKTYAQAEAATEDLILFGQQAKGELGSLNSSLAPQLQAKGQEIKAKIGKEIDSIVEQEKAKIEQELQAIADELADQMSYDLETEMMNMGFTNEAEANAYAQTRAAQIKTDIELQLKELSEEKKLAMESEIDDKIKQITGFDPEKLESISSAMENIEERINQAIIRNQQKYEVYRTQAMAKRKEIIVSVIESNFALVEAKLKENAGLFEEAKAQDPTVKTADEYLLELEADKNALAEIINSVADSGDEAAINAAVSRVRDKWESLRAKLEADSAKRQTAKQICDLAMPQLSIVKPQVKNGLDEAVRAQKEIESKSGTCLDNPDSLPCQKTKEILDKIASAGTKGEEILDKIALAEQKCSQISDNDPAQAVTEILIPLKGMGLAFQQEMADLKNNWPEIKKEIEESLNALNQ